jgi:MFS family permease
MVTNPVFGWVSDRTVRRRGHRAGWVLGGAVMGCVGAVASTYAPTLPLLVLAWTLTQISYSATFAALYGTLSDVVSPADRARVSSWFAMAAVGAIAFGGLLAAALLTGHLGAAVSQPHVVFAAMAVAGLPVALVTSWHLRTLTPRADRAIRDESPRTRGIVESVRSLGDAGAPYWWLWLQRLLAQSAYSCLTVYGVLLVIRRIGEEPKDAAVLVATMTAIAATLAMAMAAGGARRLARQVGYRAALGGGVALLLAADVTLSLTTGTSGFVLAHLLAGIGLGLYFALDLAVALTVLPPSAGGRFLGYFNIARSLPGSLIPAIGPALLAIGGGDLVGLDRSRNYFALLAFGSALALLALLVTGRLTLPETRVGSESFN